MTEFVQEGPEVVTPQYVDTDAPLERSYLNQRFKQFADAGLFHNKRFRVGFSNGWEPVCSPGSGYITFNALEDNTINDNQIGSLKSWLQVSAYLCSYTNVARIVVQEVLEKS